MRFAVVLGVIGVAGAASAQVLNVSHLPNNGLTTAGGGVFMDLTDKTGLGLLVTGFDSYASSAAGSAWTFDVYTRPGTYVGFDNSSAGWTLFTTMSGTSNGTATLAHVDLGTAISVGANETVGVYLVFTAGGLRYNGTNSLPPQSLWENSDIRMFSNTVRSAPFAGSLFNNRAFAGNVYYTPVPEPATLAALGLGLAAVIRRRRNR